MANEMHTNSYTGPRLTITPQERTHIKSGPKKQRNMTVLSIAFLHERPQFDVVISYCFVHNKGKE